MESFVTLATNDAYAIGTLVLAHSIRKVGSTRRVCIMITKEVSPAMKSVLSGVFDHVELVDVLDSGDHVNLALLQRPELGCTFTKLHCWRLTRYKKCVFLDADCLVIKPVDELFERDELSAAPDLGWPDCFNSGVFVFVPSLETYNHLLNFAITRGSFDGADQGLLNSYFSDWSFADIKKHLPFIYNVTPNIFYTYRPALKRNWLDVKIVHFLGPVKPWYTVYDRATKAISQTQISSEQNYFYSLWWEILYDNLSSALAPVLVSHLRNKVKLGVIQAYNLHEYDDVEHVYEQNRESYKISVEKQPPVQSKNEYLSSTESVASSPIIVPISAVALLEYKKMSHKSIIRRTIYFVPDKGLLEDNKSRDDYRADGDKSHVSTRKNKLLYMQNNAIKNTNKDMNAPPSKKQTTQAESATPQAPDTYIGSEAHRRAWEHGKIDYLGKDAFENIKKYLDEIINKKTSEKEKK